MLAALEAAVPELQITTLIEMARHVPVVCLNLAGDLVAANT